MFIAWRTAEGEAKRVLIGLTAAAHFAALGTACGKVSDPECEDGGCTVDGSTNGAAGFSANGGRAGDHDGHAPLSAGGIAAGGRIGRGGMTGGGRDGGENRDAGSSDDAADVRVPCAALDQYDCYARSDCLDVRAENASSDEYVGCVEASECQRDSVFARQPETGACFRVDSTCVPGDWENLGTGACDEYCSEREANCAVNESCKTLSVPTRWGDEMTLACVPSGKDCGPKEVCVQRSGRGCVRVGSECVPPGWEVVPCDREPCPDSPPTAKIESCGLEDMMAWRAGARELMDCGALEATASKEALESLAACMHEQYSMNASYRAVWAIDVGSEWVTRMGSLGLASDEGFSVLDFWYEELPDNGIARVNAYVSGCARHAAPAACPTSTFQICTACEPGSPYCVCKVDPTGGGNLYCFD